MAKVKGKEEDVFFVGIDDPVELRRTILESSKDLLQYLQRFEKFKQVRLEKQEELITLKGVTADLKKLMGKLKNTLPKTHIRARSPKKEKPETKKAKKPKEPEFAELEIPKEPETKKPVTDLEKLEHELGMIESRLTKMG